MTRLLNFKLSFFIISILLFSFCAKESMSTDKKSSNETTTEAPQAMTGELQYCFDNPNNPYEYIGVQHNLGLDAIAASPGFGNLTTEEAYDIAFQAVADNLGVTEVIPYSQVESAFELLNASEPLLETATILLAEEEISQEAHDIIVQLDELFNNSPDPHVFGIEVLNMEDSILQNQNFTVLEQEVLLGGTAVARHSTCYWITAALDVESPWYPLLNDNSINGTDAAKRSLWDWVEQAWEDVKEFVKKDVAGVKYAKKEIDKWVDGVLVTVVVWVAVGVVHSIVS